MVEGFKAFLWLFFRTNLELNDGQQEKIYSHFRMIASSILQNKRGFN